MGFFIHISPKHAKMKKKQKKKTAGQHVVMCMAAMHSVNGKCGCEDNDHIEGPGERDDDAIERDNCIRKDRW